MKKFVVLLVVVAMTCFSAMAFAADVTVGGSFEVRSKNFTNLSVAPEETAAASDRSTDNRIRIDVNAKAGDVKGKLQLQSDFGHTWGQDNASTATVDTFETIDGPGSKLGFREAWVNFNLPGIPVNITAGHQLLTLGNGWFLRSMHYGSDAWVIANQTGPNTLAFVNAKLAEDEKNLADDDDVYTILDVFKLNENMTVGADFTSIKARRTVSPDGNMNLQNLGVNFNGKLGPVALKAEVDFQMGSIEFPAPAAESDFKGNQIVIQGSVGLDPVNLNFTLARGSGQDTTSTSTDTETFQTALDVDPHYTLLYEYKVAGATGS
jgi:hypothetical protein